MRIPSSGPSVLMLVWLSALSLVGDITAATWHIDPVNGSDEAVGDESAPFRSLMRAAKIVNPGDTVLAHPGIYFEHVKLERAGTADAPITFRSSAGRDKTVVTGAWKALREGRIAWQPVDESIGMYRVERAEEPATVLCDELNLYRYPSLDELTRFYINDVAGQKKPGPGPKHGFAWAEGWLYVRLHPGGNDGATDPNAHQFKVSPARGTGFRGDEIDSRQRANFSTVTNGPAYVVVDGFTFESPGFCGVWVRHGQVTVQNCRFIGCRTGVRGWDRAEKQPRSISQDVVVQRCEFTEHPMYADVAEIVEEVTTWTQSERESLTRFYWWHRKGGAYSAEIGLVTAAGRRWMIRDNHVHDTLDGLSFMSLGWSEDCVVSGNRFERIVDNAVEVENHAQRLRVQNNYIVDCFEPFSYQPLDKAPWPADILIENNTVSFTSAGSAMFGKENLGWRPGCFKFYVTPEVSDVPGGFMVRNNLIWFPTGRLTSVSRDATQLQGVSFEGNVVAVRSLGGTESGADARFFKYTRNHALAVAAEGVEPLGTLVGNGGQIVQSAAQLGILGVDPKTGTLEIKPNSAAATVGSNMTP